jgi:hypothetical protein
MVADVEWRDDGFFSSTGEVGVKGVASDVEVVAEVLRRAGILKTSRPVYRARPTREVRDNDWTSAAAADASDVDSDLDRKLGEGRPDGLVARLLGIASELPSSHDQLAALARAGKPAESRCPASRFAPLVHSAV